VKNKLAESDIELAAIEWLEELGYTYLHGGDINRDLKKVVLKDRFIHFINQKYKHLPEIMEQAEGQYKEWPMVG